MEQTSFSEKLPKILGTLAMVPLMFILADYWNKSGSYENTIYPYKTLLFISIVAGTLTGIAFNWQKNNILKGIIVGAIAGVISGSIFLWWLGVYYSLRGYPSTMYKIEFVIIACVPFGIGVLIKALLNKLLGINNN